jgi:Flp pilus assembly protein TadD
LRRAIALRDGVAIAYAALGTIETDRGRDREAEAALRTYMQLAPQSPDGPERLALLFLASGRAPDALPLLHRARDLRGAAAPTRSGPSVDGMPGRDPRAAPTEAALGEAVDLIGANARMLQYLGHLLVHRGHGAAALVPLRRAVVLTPADAVSRFWLVKAYLLEGRLDQARRETEALRAVSPRLAEIAWSQMPATHGGPGTRQPR